MLSYVTILPVNDFQYRIVYVNYYISIVTCRNKTTPPGVVNLRPYTPPTKTPAPGGQPAPLHPPQKHPPGVVSMRPYPPPPTHTHVSDLFVDVSKYTHHHRPTHRSNPYRAISLRVPTKCFASPASRARAPVTSHPPPPSPYVHSWRDCAGREPSFKDFFSAAR